MRRPRRPPLRHEDTIRTIVSISACASRASPQCRGCAGHQRRRHSLRRIAIGKMKRQARQLTLPSTDDFARRAPRATICGSARTSSCAAPSRMERRSRRAREALRHTALRDPLAHDGEDLQAVLVASLGAVQRVSAAIVAWPTSFPTSAKAFPGASTCAAITIWPSVAVKTPYSVDRHVSPVCSAPQCCPTWCSSAPHIRIEIAVVQRHVDVLAPPALHATQQRSADRRDGGVPVYMSPSAMRSSGDATPGVPTICMIPLLASAIRPKPERCESGPVWP